MDLPKDLITIDPEMDQPVYLQIVGGFINNIRKGRLRKGLKLPGSRNMAAMLNINRMTMVAAYDELEAQGWIETIPRKGAFVKPELTEFKPSQPQKAGEAMKLPKKASFPIDRKPTADFPLIEMPLTDQLIINGGFPDIRLAPIELLIRNMRRAARLPAYDKYFHYGDAQGTPLLRETLANHLSDTRGIPVSASNIIITRGSQMGMYIASRLLISPDDHVIVGEPGYFGANMVFEQNGAILDKVPVDDHGMDVDAVERICQKREIRFLYVIPHHHLPTTVTLTPERRMKLLELASRYRFAIIEDDYDYDFHYTSNPMLPMAGLDQNGSVIYIGTLTKTLAPAIRIGFMAGPDNFIRSVSRLRRIIDMQGDNLLEVAIAELYNDGTIARHIRKSVKLYHKRRDHFCDLMKSELGDRVSFRIPDGGMSVWTTFNDTDLGKLSRTAFKKGLAIGDGREYNTGNVNYNSLRMGFASLNMAEQEQAIGILAGCLRDL